MESTKNPQSLIRISGDRSTFHEQEIQQIRSPEIRFIYVYQEVICDMLKDVFFWIIIPIIVGFGLFRVLVVSEHAAIQKMLNKLDSVFLERRSRFRFVFQAGIAVLLLILFLAVTRGHKPSSLWSEGELTLCVPSNVWESHEAILRNTFECVIRTPQPEHVFRIVRAAPENISKSSLNRYIILMAVADRHESVGCPACDSLLSDLHRTNSNARTGFAWSVVEDLWAENQTVLVIAANDSLSLTEGIAKEGKVLFGTLEEALLTYQKNDLPHLKNAGRFRRDLADTHGWTLGNPAHLEIIKYDEDLDLVIFGTLTPGSWLSVRKFGGIDAADVDPAWVIERRNELGRFHYGDHKVENAHLHQMCSDFLGRPSVVTSGLWGDEEPHTGGPFKNYTFYDPATERVYMIDLCVFAPGKLKLPRLRVLEAIARTFEVVERKSDTAS